MSPPLHWQFADTPALRQACYALRATEYARYYGNIPTAEFHDEYDASAHAHLIAVCAGDDVVGTCRLVESHSPANPYPSSEISTLTTLDWQALANRTGLPPNELRVGELGKYSVATTAAEHLRAKWLLLVATGLVAQQCGLNMVVALMSKLVWRVAHNMNFPFHLHEGVRLRRTDPTVRRTLLRYHDYFLPQLRRHCSEAALAALDQLDDHATASLIDQIPDGSHLWWITPTELANNPYPKDES